MNTEADVDAFVAARPPHIGAIVRLLRALVLAAAADAREVFNDADNNIQYGLTESRGTAILYLTAVGERWVRLGFFFGAGLPNLAGLVEGEGVRLRHVKVRTPVEAENPALDALIRQGWADGVAALNERRRRGS